MCYFGKSPIVIINKNLMTFKKVNTPPQFWNNMQFQNDFDKMKIFKEMGK